MTRGNQRNQDREAKQKREADDKGARKDGKGLAKARLDDAEIMRQKQEAGLGQKARHGRVEVSYPRHLAFARKRHFSISTEVRKMAKKKWFCGLFLQLFPSMIVR